MNVLRDIAFAIIAACIAFPIIVFASDCLDRVQRTEDCR